MRANVGLFWNLSNSLKRVIIKKHKIVTRLKMTASENQSVNFYKIKDVKHLDFFNYMQTFVLLKSFRKQPVEDTKKKPSLNLSVYHATFLLRSCAIVTILCAHETKNRLQK